MKINEDYVRNKNYVKKITAMEITETETRELMERLHSGEESVRDRIIEGNLLHVYYIANSVYKDNQDIPLEDLIQYANLNLMRYIDKFDTSRNIPFRRYLWGIKFDLWELCRDMRYAVRCPGEYKDLKLEFTMLGGSSKSPMEYVLEKEAKQKFEEIFDSLEEHEKKVIYYLYRNENKTGMTYRDISKKMNVSQNEVKRIEALALKKMRKRVNCE